MKDKDTWTFCYIPYCVVLYMQFLIIPYDLLIYMHDSPGHQERARDPGRGAVPGQRHLPAQRRHAHAARQVCAWGVM